MNKLPVVQRANIFGMLCEGASMRSVLRLADVSINTGTSPWRPQDTLGCACDGG